MNETQEPLTLQQRQAQQSMQRRVQQRQILAMMGINQWIQPSSATLNIADIDAVADNELLQQVEPLSVTSPAFESTSAQDALSLAAPAQPVLTSVNNVQDISERIIEDSSQNIEPLPSYYIDSLDNSPLSAPVDSRATVTGLVQPLITKATAAVDPSNNDSTNNYKKTLDKVVPFDLQGGRYGNWVLLVDIQALSSDSQKLWQNVCQALSLECETTSFPICAGMDTAELANASLAGYIFKIGRSEDIQVVALTELPKLLTHPNMVSAPSLEAMLTDSTLKRQLWQQISNQA